MYLYKMALCTVHFLVCSERKEESSQPASRTYVPQKRTSIYFLLLLSTVAISFVYLRVSYSLLLFSYYWYSYYLLPN